MRYYAHSKENHTEDHWQLLVDHLTQTATLAQSFADRFNGGEFAYIVGLLHDIGKYSPDFQRRLQGDKKPVDHSTAGAQEAIAAYGPVLGKIFAYSIAGHHAGLPDFGSQLKERNLEARLHRDLGKRHEAFRSEIKIPQVPRSLSIKPITAAKGFSMAFFIRMLFSCLTDADFLNTEAFLNKNSTQRGHYPSIMALHQRLDQFLADFCKDKKEPIHLKRGEILQRCIHFSTQTPGMYTLTVATGGGKTISSLAFALKHAQTHCLERIIYVIPYTSIIEQNAKQFKEILGEESVLEHHSNIQNDLKFHDEETEPQTAALRMKLATENWDIPVVATTNVQFYESLFGNRSSRCRKLHNISKSVIILDEAQMIPVEYLKPCLYALSELVTNYGSTVVLCTATQPALQSFLPNHIQLQEIMENPEELYHFFRRVRVKKRGVMTDESVAHELRNLPQVLCIVNTKKHAVKLYDQLKKESGVYHLSTFMCPAHRRKILDQIRDDLKDNRECRVISTQLIEAGVDVDFPVVYRSMAGIDSIVQSAGRCNRENKCKTGGEVHVFTSGEEYGHVKGWLQQTAEVGEMVFRQFDDVTSLEAVKRYFEYLYDVKGEEGLDQKEIILSLEKRARECEFPFEEVAEKFKLIENHMYTIIIPYEDNAELIREARYSPYPKEALRALQPYTVSVYEYQYHQLFNEGALDIVNDMLIILKERSYYSNETGLLVQDSIQPSGEAWFDS